MIPTKISKHLEKQKRLSESKVNTAYGYKFPHNISINYHNRSSSTDKNKKPRLLTEYDDN